MTPIRIREHGRIGIAPEAAHGMVTPRQARALVVACRGEALQFASDREIRAKEIVGIVVAAGVVVEILPKIDEVEGDASARLHLVRMLSEAGMLPISVAAAEALDWRRVTLLEAVCRAFVDSLEDAARRGLARRYVAQDEDLPKLRGRIDLARQYGRLAAAPQLLACRFDEFSVDTPLNRALKCALDLCTRLSASGETRRRAGRCGGWLDDVTPLPADRIDWSVVRVDRTSQRFGALVQLARLLLTGLRQTTSAGSDRGFCLLFDMNLLFEQFIGRHVARAFPGRVRLQGPHRHALSEAPSGRPAFLTIPDIVHTATDGTCTVIDTKWKRLKAEHHALDVGQADVYQMMAYAQVYRASHMVLLYPMHSGLAAAPLPRRFMLPDGQATLEVRTIALENLSRVPDAVRSLLARDPA